MFITHVDSLNGHIITLIDQFIFQMLSCFPLLVIMLTTVAATPCLFNSMCTCKTDEALRMHIACVAVPLYTIPGNWKYTYPKL